MTVIGLGVDLVQVARLREVLDRTPGVADRLFTAAEREAARPDRLAARFAAKEAAVKALGGAGTAGTPGAAASWRDVEVVTGESGAPHLRLHGRLAERAAERGIRSWHVSLSHDSGFAVAVVVAEA